MKEKISNETRKAIYHRDNYACVLCDDNRRLQIHHCIKRSQGGTNEPENLVTLCATCHALAHNIRLAGVDYPMDAAEIGQAIVEYLADYYAGNWYPWEEGKGPMDEPKKEPKKKQKNRPFDWAEEAPELAYEEDEREIITFHEYDSRPFDPDEWKPPVA